MVVWSTVVVQGTWKAFFRPLVVCFSPPVPCWKLSWVESSVAGEPLDFGNDSFGVMRRKGKGGREGGREEDLSIVVVVVDVAVRAVGADVASATNNACHAARHSSCPQFSDCSTFEVKSSCR